MILPSLPFFVMEHAGDSATWGGALLMSYSVGQLAGAPILGRASDRYGRRPVILFSLAGSTLALTATGLATGLGSLIAARFIAGLMAGSVSTAQAYIADVTAPEERAGHMGKLGAAVAAGFVFGPAVGGLLGQEGFQLTAFAAAGLAFMNFLLASVVLAESRKPNAEARASGGFSFAALRSLFAEPTRARTIAALCMAMLAFVAMETTFAFLGKRNFDLTPRGMGVIFTITGIVTGAVQGLLLGRLTARFGERVLAMAGTALMGGALVALPFAHRFEIAATVTVFLALGSGLSTPSLHSLLSRATPEDQQGRVLGASQGLTASTRAWGPLLAGALYDIDVYAPYMGSALLMWACALLLRGVAQPAVAAPAAPELAGS